MPTINNETVIGSGYVTYRNARPQLLSNGWIVVAVYSSSATRLQFRVKKTAAGAWEDLAFLTTSNVLSWSLQVKGTRVFATLHTSSSNATSFLNFDATTVSSSTTLSTAVIDSTSTSGAFSGEDLAINDAGTELHHVFSAKTPTYPNSFNARYLKGTIATDGSVTWGLAEQVTTVNSSTYANVSIDPTMILVKNMIPAIFVRNIGLQLLNAGTISNQSGITVLKRDSTLSTSTLVSSPWTYKTVITTSSTRSQTSQNAIFIPQSINGLVEGRAWLAFSGEDDTDNLVSNIRTTFSDDGGVSWATPTKHTTGNTYSQTNVSLSADKNGKVLLYWDGEENVSGNTVTVTKEKIFNSTWGATTSLSGDNYFKVSTLLDRFFSIGMTRAPLVRYDASGARFTGNYYVPASVSPLSSALGNKETPSVLSYTVTPESGSTITSIVEKVNGTTVNTYSNPASLSRTFTIPLANWDALKYYNTHTISVTVTDSNGMSNTQTYTFNKALANDASLLEGAKAAKDGKDRISTKRDVLAGQVGLPAGSTFDAISAALGTGTLKKQATGTTDAVWKTTSQLSCDVSGLGFAPRTIIVYATSNVGEYGNPFGLLADGINRYMVANFNTSTTTGTVTGHLSDTSSVANTPPNGSFSIIVLRDASSSRTVNSTVPVVWIAIE